MRIHTNGSSSVDGGMPLLMGVNLALVSLLSTMDDDFGVAGAVTKTVTVWVVCARVVVVDVLLDATVVDVGCPK